MPEVTPAFLSTNQNFTMGRFHSKTVIQDPVFGSMTMFDDETGCYGMVHFTPVNKEIEIYLDTNAWGPTEKQRVLFKEIELCYFQNTENLPELLEEVFRKEKPGFRIADFRKEFELSAVRIPKLEATPLCWEFHFETSHYSDGWVTVEYNNYEPLAVYFDQ